MCSQYAGAFGRPRDLSEREAVASSLAPCILACCCSSTILTSVSPQFARRQTEFGNLVAQSPVCTEEAGVALPVLAYSLGYGQNRESLTISR
jgi:hypothetical protein